MELDKIRELVKMVEESQIQEIELSNRGETIRISKAGAAQFSIPAPAQAIPIAPTAQATAPTPAVAAGEIAEPGAASRGENTKDVQSPMVGTFYQSPSPDAEVFVSVGDKVKKGDLRWFCRMLTVLMIRLKIVSWP